MKVLQLRQLLNSGTAADREGGGSRRDAISVPVQDSFFWHLWHLIFNFPEQFFVAPSSRAGSATVSYSCPNQDGHFQD